MRIMFVKVVAIAWLAVACVSGATPRRSSQLLEAAGSQTSGQTASAPNSLEAARQAQQAKLHYVEIGPSLKGDYKFGYDTGSGPAGQSFREETRLDDGTVKGAYGYVDANGKQRIVKYSAGKAGFVVESDQEAGNSNANSQKQPEVAAAPQPVHRPQPVALPQAAAAPLTRIAAQPATRQEHHHHHQAPAQPAVSFDEQQNSQQAPALTRQQAEQQHAQQLRQHQLAQQHALAQQQHLAQQQQIQQQQLIQEQQQQQALAAQQQQAQQEQLAAQAPAQAAQQAPAINQAQAQPQFSAPQHQAHQFHQQQPQAQHHHHQLHQAQQAPPPPAPIVHSFNQNGHFFAQSNDANLNQLLAQQLRQLQQHQAELPQHQQKHQFHQHQQPQVPQHQAFAPAQAPSQLPQFGGIPQTDFFANPPQGHQVRASRQANFQGSGAEQQAAPQASPVAPTPNVHGAANPQAALLALHQQQQHDAQILANLRAQQLAQLEQHQRQQRLAPTAAAAPSAPAHHHQHQHHDPQSQPQQHQQAAFQHQPAPSQFQAPTQTQPQVQAQAQPQHQSNRLAASGAQVAGPVVQPEVFGPPVIDIRTLNYSIGQQTRVH